MPRPGNIKRDLEILAKLTALKMGVLQRQIADQPDVDLSQLQQYRTAPATRTATGNGSLSREPID